MLQLFETIAIGVASAVVCAIALGLFWLWFDSDDYNC